MNRWNDRYVEGSTPWDTGVPDPLLVAAVANDELPRGRILEVGCGTGTNARYLAEQGWDVVAVDVAPAAIEAARAAGGDVRYEVHDILESAPPGGPFDAVFDRGCFHVFQEPDERARFAARVAEVLRPGGVWLSLLGSTEGPPREIGPPRRSAREIVEAVEPVLELRALRGTWFADHDDRPAAWVCLSRRRSL